MDNLNATIPIEGSLIQISYCVMTLKSNRCAVVKQRGGGKTGRRRWERLSVPVLSCYPSTWEVRASKSIRGSKSASAKEARWNIGDPASKVK